MRAASIVSSRIAVVAACVMVYDTVELLLLEKVSYIDFAVNRF